MKKILMIAIVCATMLLSGCALIRYTLMAGDSADVRLSYVRYPEMSFGHIENIAVLPFQEGTLDGWSIWRYSTDAFLLQIADDLTDKINERKIFRIFDRDIAPKEPSVQMVIFGLVTENDVSDGVQVNESATSYTATIRGKLAVSYRFVVPTSGELLHMVKLEQRYEKSFNASSYQEARAKLPSQHSVRKRLISSINKAFIATFTPTEIWANYSLATIPNDKRFIGSLMIAKSGGWDDASKTWTEYETENLPEAYYNNMLYKRYIKKDLPGALSLAEFAAEQGYPHNFNAWIIKFKREQELEYIFKNSQAALKDTRRRLAAGLQSELISVSEDERGTVVSMSDNLFESGSVEITDNLRENLAKVVSILTVNESAKVLVEGHSDNVGSREVNQKISEDRANAVLNYFTEQGIAAERMSAIGHAFDKPIADNSTQEGRAKNRRVDIIIQEGTATDSGGTEETE